MVAKSEYHYEILRDEKLVRCHTYLLYNFQNEVLKCSQIDFDFCFELQGITDNELWVSLSRFGYMESFTATG